MSQQSQSTSDEWGQAARTTTPYSQWVRNIEPYFCLWSLLTNPINLPCLAETATALTTSQRCCWPRVALSNYMRLCSAWLLLLYWASATRQGNSNYPDSQDKSRKYWTLQKKKKRTKSQSQTWCNSDSKGTCWRENRELVEASSLETNILNFELFVSVVSLYVLQHAFLKWTWKNISLRQWLLWRLVWEKLLPLCF